MDAILNNKYTLGFLPTPLHRITLGNVFPGYKLYIKRDDQTGLATGGNKTRKLEYLIREALQQGCDTVITAGAQQSNHCRQTAAACAMAGLRCHLLLGGEAPPFYNGNLLISHLMGATLHFKGDNRKGEDMHQVQHELAQAGHQCFAIPYGGSNLTGALGFVNAVRELTAQLEEQAVTIDYLFFASSSGGMQAGLMLGIEGFGLPLRLMPVSIDKTHKEQPLQEGVLRLVQEGKKTLHLQKEYTLQDVELITGYDTAGYGVVSSQEKEAIQLLARHDGILLDPVYTARAFAGMLDHLRKEIIPPGSNVLFWHSGGLPATFEYAAELR